MKYMILSDIHGSADAAERAAVQYRKHNADILIILGDILYHGPRNPLPAGHNPAETARILNDFADTIIAVRGNCDAEVDQMLLDFPCIADYAMIVDEGRRIFATHGHIYNEEHMPKLKSCDLFLSGHTHIARIQKKGSVLFCNPGSISLPKDDRGTSFLLLDGKHISLFSLDGDLIERFNLSSPI